MKPKAGRMKTPKRSPERLRLYHFPWYYTAVAAVFGLLGLYATVNLFASGDLRDAAISFYLGCGISMGLALTATRARGVKLDGRADLVTTANRSAFSRMQRDAPRGALKQSHLQTSSPGDRSLHRLILHYEDRDSWVVTKMYASHDGTMVAIEAIISWLNKTRAEAHT